jgi:hypothetical protein
MGLPSPGSFAGAILSTTAQGPASNVVAGADVSLRKRGSSLQMTGMALYSSATAADGKHTEGLATLWTGGMSSRRYDLFGQVEHYDRDFQMDSAFYNRTGFTGAWTFDEISFYPKSTWLQRVHPFVFAKYARDRIQDGDEDFVHTGVRFNVTRQGFLNSSHGRGHETWQGTKYRVGSDVNFFGNMQTLRWLSLGGNYRHGPSIYYDELDPFQGRSRSVGVSATIQPNQHLSQDLDVNRERFWRPAAACGRRVPRSRPRSARLPAEPWTAAACPGPWGTRPRGSSAAGGPDAIRPDRWRGARRPGAGAG